jgi:putative tryptophan/tyrosine transport system substrate-binding protein
MSAVWSLSGGKADMGGRSISVAIDPLRTSGVESSAAKVSIGSISGEVPPIRCVGRAEGNMKRREFIGLVGGAAAMGWSHSAHAAERKVGVLIGLSQTNVSVTSRLGAFREALSGLGWVEGRNIKVEYRFEPDATRLNQFATELVERGCELIVAWSTPEVVAAMAATKTIPIVFFTAADPVRSRIIQSLARPGGNVTGATNFEPAVGSKWVGVLHELAPTTTRVAVLTNTMNSAEQGMDAAVKDAAAKKGLAAVTLAAQKPDNLKSAVEDFGQAPGGGLIIIPSISTSGAIKLILDLAARLHLPAVYPYRFFAETGGLVSYGADYLELARRAASHVDKILSGTKPSDIPVEGPTKFELVLNLKTAKQLGLVVPQTLLVAADEVIE